MEREQLTATVRAAQQGDEKALNLLFNTYYNDVYYFALKTLKDEDLACDITQETFVEIINTLGELKVPEAFVTWMRQVTYHQCTRYFKKKKEVLVEEDEDGNSVFDTLEEEREEFIPGEGVDKEDFRATILALLDTLSEEQRAAVLMHYYHEMSVKDIAEAQQVSEGTVKSRLNYARKSLKKSVEDYEKKHDVKLHCAGVLPLLLWLFASAGKEVMPVAAAKTVAGGVATATGVPLALSAGGGVATVTATTAAGTGLMSKIVALPVAVKIISCITAGALLIGSISVAVLQKDDDNKDGLLQNPSTSATTIPESETGKPHVTEPTTLPVADPSESEKPTEPEAVADGTCGDNLIWVLTDDGVLTISGEGDMYGYYPSEYPAPWYSEQEKITAVVLQHGVTSIGGYAFSDCSSLTSVTIPDSVTIIGIFAFLGCNSLIGVTIPNGVTSIEAGVLSGCSSLTSVTIPDGVTYIDDNMFSGCSSLTSVMIPDSVTSIGDGMFDGCGSLTSITIPDSVTSIGDYAFCNCSNLTSVTIPDSVTCIGNSAFDGCSCLTSVTIPDSVTSIGEFAFSGCSSLTGMTIPDGITSIGYAAFEGCSSLTSVTIPGSVTSIGANAFYDCSSLTSVTIPDGVTSIGYATFEGCSSLTSVTIPDSVTNIGECAFYDCSSLTSVIIPDSVTSIGNLAFHACSNLTSVTIPDSVTYIGGFAFFECNSLWHVLYKGTEAQWNAIDIRANNDGLTSAIRHYECTGEEAIDPVNKICPIC